MSYDHFAKRTSKGTSKDKRTAPRIGVPVYHFKRRVVHSDGESHPSEISPTGRIVGGCIGRGSGEPLHDHQETSERFTGGAVRKKGRMTNVGSGSVYDWHSESRISSREHVNVLPGAFFAFHEKLYDEATFRRRVVIDSHCCRTGGRRVPAGLLSLTAKIYRGRNNGDEK